MLLKTKLTERDCANAFLTGTIDWESMVMLIDQIREEEKSERLDIRNKIEAILREE